MGREPRVTAPGEFFHVVSRGNHRANVFFEAADWERFLDILTLVKTLLPFRLHAYCLMTNHLHLLIETLEAQLSAIMHRLLLRYALYINRKLERTGHVYQDRYKPIPCTRDAYLQHLVRYIHMNPVRAGLVASPADWPYSSHLEYLGKGRRALVDPSFVLSSFSPLPSVAIDNYLDFMNAADALVDPKMREIDLNPWRMASEDPGPEPGVPPIPLDTLLATAAGEHGLGEGQLRVPSKVRRIVAARRSFMRSAYRSGYTPKQIAGFLGVALSTISESLSAG